MPNRSGKATRTTSEMPTRSRKLFSGRPLAASRDQSDPQFPFGARHCDTSGASLPPPTASGHTGQAQRRIVPRMIRIVEDLSGDWRRLDERIEHITAEIEVLAQGSESCRQLMTVPGVGPIIASAMVAAIGNGTTFAKGRDFAAWLGLIPKQMSTGDRTILGRITKRGNRYLRTLFMQGARVILLRPAN